MELGCAGSDDVSRSWYRKGFTYHKALKWHLHGSTDNITIYSIKKVITSV